MLSIRNINPMVRAVGTMTAVAAIVGGLTFAAGGQKSNTVTLTDNKVSTETAGLTIADGSCTDTPPSTTTDTGIQATNLAPGVAQTFQFCIANTGSAPESITMTSPSTVSTATGDVTPADVTVNVSCASTTGTDFTLDTLASQNQVVDSSLTNGTSGDTCTETVTLNSGFTGQGGSLTPYELDFQGTTLS